MAQRRERPSRRDVLRDAMLGAGAAGLTGLCLDATFDLGRAARADPTVAGARRRTLTAAEWRAFEAASDRLLPRDEWGPGARDVNAVGYTDAALADRTVRPVDRAALASGLAVLDRMARASRAPDFAALPPAEQDRVLAAFEKTRDGLPWMRQALGFTLEALLGDPVHGGNPEGIGWAWGEIPELKPRPPSAGWRPRGR